MTQRIDAVDGRARNRNTSTTEPLRSQRYLSRDLTCDFQQCGILTSVDSDEPVKPPFKLRKTTFDSTVFKKSTFSIVSPYNCIRKQI